MKNARRRPVLVRTALVLLEAAASLWLHTAGSSAQGSPLALRQTVTSNAELKAVLAQAGPGSIIEIAPGSYGPFSISGLSGTAEAPITIRAQDLNNKPLIDGGSVGLLMIDSSHVTIRGLRFRRQLGNAINCSGSTLGSAHHIAFEDIEIEDAGIGMGQGSNVDGFKMTRMSDYSIKRSVVTGWTGQAVDQVNCRFGLIEDSRFIAKPTMPEVSGIQAKGWSHDITIRRCEIIGDSSFANFEGVAIGNNTSPDYPGGQETGFYAALRITVEDSFISGGRNAANFNESKDCIFRRNTVVYPHTFLLMIYQGNRDPRLGRSCCGQILDNVFIYRKSDIYKYIAVLPDYTQPETFEFRRNIWVCTDNGGEPCPPTAPGTDPRTALPVVESGGIYRGKLPAGAIPAAPLNLRIAPA